MKTKTTKITGILLTLVMMVSLLGLFSLTASAAEVASGTSGDVSWTLSDDGTLTFSGEGAIVNYSLLERPTWYSYETQIKKVVIRSGVTSIGNNAFNGCSVLTEVVLPDTLNSIGNNAFNDCAELSYLEYWGTTEPAKIGMGVFGGCDKLLTVNVPTDYDGDSFATVFGVSKTLVPASPCDHSGDVDTATGNCSLCGMFAAAVSLKTADATPVVTYYATLEEALIAAQSSEGSTITLLGDVDPSAALQNTNTLIIDLNGHNVNAAYGAILSNSGSLTITGSGSYNGRINNRGTMVINANIGGYVEAYEGKLTVIGGTIQSLVIYANDIASLKGGTFNELKIIIEQPGLSDSSNLSNNLYKILAYGKLYSHSDIETARYRYDPNNGMLIDFNGNIGHAWFTSPVSVLEDDPVIPTIYTQPVGADYTMIDTAEALSVTATNNDDGGTLSYQWYSDTDDDAIGGTAIIDAIGAAYTPPIDAVGTVYYYCVVTNSKTGFEPKPITTSAVKVTVTKATPKPSDFTAILPTDLTYNGEGKAVTVIANDGIVGMGEITVKYLDEDLNPVNGLPTNKGVYRVEISVAEGTNYTARNDLYLLLDIFPVTLGESNIVMAPEEFIYNGAEQKPTIAVVVDGRIPVLDVDYKLTWDKDGFEDAGTYTVTIKGIGNYEGTIEKSYVINPKPLVDGDISINSAEETYSGGAYFPTISVKDGDVWLSTGPYGDFDINWDKDGFVDAGTYTATITGKNNYSGSFTRTFVIKQAEFEIEFTSPIISVLPGNQIALTLNTNSDATPLWTLDNATIVSGTTIKVNDGLVIGQDKVTITVTYDETANVKGGSKTITLDVGMADFSGAIADLEADIAELNKLIEEGGDVDQINAKLSEITNKLTTLEQNGATDDELVAAIDAAKTELTTAYEKAIKDATDKVYDAINESTKNDAYELAKAVAELKTLIDSAKKVAAEEDALLKGEIAAAIANAETELDNAVAELEAKLGEEVTKLQDQINANNADIDGINDSITTINGLIDALKQADEVLDGDISDAIAKAENELKVVQEELKDLIGDVQTDLDNAKAELDKAIADLDAAMKQGDTELSDKIANLDTALANAKSALEKADADNKAELIDKIEAADATLDAAIKTVQKNLDDAKAELNKAIADGDTALDGKITALNEALANAKAALEKADADNKTELTAKIDDAYASLDTAIKTVQNILFDYQVIRRRKDDTCFRILGMDMVSCPGHTWSRISAGGLR